MDFSVQIFFNDSNHGYRVATLQKNSLRLLPLYMAVATYSYYEKVRRTMHTAFVTYLLNLTKLFNDQILFVCLPYIGQSSLTFLSHEH